MDAERTLRLSSHLTSPDPAVVASALDDLRMLDLGELSLLAVTLRLTDDLRPLPSRAAGDPFAAFFGDASAGATVGRHATDQLVRAGLPGFEAVADVLAASLDEPGATGARAAAIARLLAEAPWDDRTGAVARVLPGLLRADTSLYALVVSSDDATLDVLRRAATSPFHARLVNELLNHEPARDAVLEALGALLTDGAPSASEALQIVGLAHQWRWERAPEVARAAAARFPWGSAFAALHDASAVDAVLAWVRGPDEDPPDLSRILELVVPHYDLPARYPVAEVLRRIDGSCATVVATGSVAATVDLLREWVGAGLRGYRPDRGWQATALLARAGELGDDLAGPVVDALPDAPLDTALFSALGSTGAPGLDRALAALVSADPAVLSAVGPALAAVAAPPVLRELLTSLLDRASAAPVVRIPKRRGLVETRRHGFDVPALEPLVDAVGDAALRATWADLLPVVGPAG